MASILTVTFGDGDIAEQLFALKICALRNHDIPALWRLTDRLMEVLLATACPKITDRWPLGYVSENRLFDVPVDYVHDLPHLLCEEYVIYPYTVNPPRLWVS
jgi:hypothetical protein